MTARGLKSAAKIGLSVSFLLTLATCAANAGPDHPGFVLWLCAGAGGCWLIGALCLWAALRWGARA